MWTATTTDVFTAPSAISGRATNSGGLKRGRKLEAAREQRRLKRANGCQSDSAGSLSENNCQPISSGSNYEIACQVILAGSQFDADECRLSSGRASSGASLLQPPNTNDPPAIRARSLTSSPPAWTLLSTGETEASSAGEQLAMDSRLKF